MEIPLVTIATKIAGYAVAPIGEWLCYSFRYSDNIENMKNEGEQLQSIKKRVQHSVEAALRNVEQIEGDVNLWLRKADATTVKLNKVLEGNEEAQMRCLYGACVNFKLRHQLSRKAKKIAQDIRELLESGRLFGKDVSYTPATEWMMTATDPDYVILESRMSATRGLMDALADTNINMIGVWGMGGVGKTTLVREVARQAKEGNFFDEVAMTDVTQEPDLKKIQQEIAEMLDLRLVEESVIVRASRLRQRLKPDMIKKKALIILDDIWDTLDLKRVGIPSEGCTLILISRNRDVLVSKMGTEKDFGLGVLNEAEAWSLFEKMRAGGNSLTDPDIRSTAAEVAKECAGLPIALVTVARAFKSKEGKKLSEWKDALVQLRRPVPGPLTQMLETVYKPIKFSYEHLGSEDKSVFLLCAHMGYITYYGDLLRYCYGLGLFGGIRTLDDARNRLHKILGTLKVSCLLQDIPHDSERFRMHDIVVDVARYIASTELYHKMFVMGDDGGLHAWPDVDALQRCEALSVLGGDIRELPEGMQCPALKFFYINGGNLGAFQIPRSFFEGMENLKVLDLTKMQLPSLHLLQNLKTLYLCQSVLGDISIIGKLRNLEILGIINSEVSELPWEIRGLTHLRMLDLSGCSKLEVIPRNVLSSLVKLEELIMGNSFVQWEAEVPNNNGRQNASLAELKHLPHLTTLEIHIPDASLLPRDLTFEKLERYEIVVGDVWDWSDKRETPRTLKLKLKTRIQAKVEIQKLLKKLLKKCERLFIDELKGVSVVQELDMEGLQHLKLLYIQNNVEIKHIVNSSMSTVAFPDLDTVILKNMINLEGVCRGQLPSASFGKLRVIRVDHCVNLKFLFSSSIVRGLSLLHELEIKECGIMRAIVMKEEGDIEDGDEILFPQLEKLTLDSLPKLLSFLSKGCLSITEAEDIIPEENNEFYTPVLHEQVQFPKLRVLELSSIHLEEMARFSGRLTNIQPITSRFQNLSSLIVKGCSNIRYLLSFSTTRAMVQLQMLQVVECKHMEEILTQDLGEEEIANPEDLFPRLEILLLQHLPILERFCIGRNIKFPSMRLLRIEHCPKLMTFIFNPVSSSITAREEVMTTYEKPHNVMQPLFNEDVAMPKLELLKISHIDGIESMWHNRFTANSCCKLRQVNVQECANLKSFFPPTMMKVLGCLELLIIENCGSLTKVFDIEVPSFQEMGAMTASQFKTLRLTGLPKLKHIWEKDPEGTFNFQNLQIVTLTGCESLQSVFPASVSGKLKQLEFLVLDNCGVEVVIEKKGAQVAETLQFPKLTALVLASLPKLKCFSRGMRPSEWPSLKILKVYGCGQIEKFALFQQRQLDASVPLFVVDEGAFPELEDLTLELNRAVWPGQFLEELLCKLKVLWVGCNYDGGDFSPSTFIGRLHNLETLRVCSNKWKEIFPYEVLFGQENHARSLTNLRELEFFENPMLTHLWKEDMQPCPIFENLKILKVSECQKLSNLVPSTVSFQNLTNLEIFKCDGLIHLFTSSTARTLKELKILSVSECRRITEIVESEGGEANEVITFSNLAYLKFDCLAILTNFCSGSYSFDFPALEEVTVRQCPAMKISRPGVLNTPKLKKVQATHLWKDDMQPCPIFKNLEILKVSECHKLSNLVPFRVSFQKLTHLEIFKCDGLIHLFTSSMARSLEKLKKLSVSECKSIMKIVRSEGEANHEVLITFRDLAYLKLDCLAVLENFCSGSYSFSFPALEEVNVRQCPVMKIFCPGVLSTPKLKKVQATEEDQEGHWIKVDLNSTIDWLWEHNL